MLLLKVGRISHIPPPDLGDDERDDYMAKVTEKDAPADKYRAINEDAPVQGMESSWISKTVGDS